MFGKKPKRIQQNPSETSESDNKITAIEPYEDEPAAWAEMSLEQLLEVWYHLADETATEPQPNEVDPTVWYLKAAHTGNIAAQYALGKYYYRSGNVFQAEMWYSKADTQNNPFADYELAKLCEYGVGMEINKVTARNLYQRAYDTLSAKVAESPNKAIALKLSIMCDHNLVDAPEGDAGHWHEVLHDHIQESQNAPKPKIEAQPEKVPVEYIIPSKDNPYAKNDKEGDYYALAMSIQANGLIYPLTLNKISDTEYQIIAGERRYQSITRYLHWPAIPATVYHGLSENAAQLMLHTANLEVRDYTAAQKLQYYIQTEQLLRKMQVSGEYTGSVQQGISETLGISTHQVRKYKRIIENLSEEQMDKVVNGTLSIERAYKLTLVPSVKNSDVPEDVETGRTSAPSPEPDVPEIVETGRASAPSTEPDVPEDVEAGRASAPFTEPDVPEDVEAGRASASFTEPDVPKDVETGRASAHFTEPDVETGRTSTIKDTIEINNPKDYTDTLAMLSTLPVEPGQICAILDGDKVDGGTIDRIEIYENAVLLSVMVESLRRPYPVSQLGKSIFVGAGCFDRAEEIARNNH